MLGTIRASRLFAYPSPSLVTRRLSATAPRNTALIPVIDFTQFREAERQSERKHVADKIVSAFKESGFIYLSGHGIPARRERVTQSADPIEIAALRAKAPDCKESMEIGRDWDAEWKNQWPQETDVPKFKKTMLDFYHTCHSLHVQVMGSIALGLDLEEDFFDKKIDEQCHNLRLLSYPPIKTNLLQNSGQARAGSHSDYGTLTLLFQDSVGGLEVQNPHTGSFVPAKPIPGTIVINVGDLLARWSNDVLRSTLHRVVAPPAKQVKDDKAITPARQSIAFFCNPNFSTEVSRLPNCGRVAKYPPVSAGEYIVGRLAVTYS
ncbi:hypothetical protein C0992_004620 [Termitomyces sp. T32_za158]|nr:hypothetical protein C0992_004620 [Termitomyces sp. T32_za158]